MIFKVKNDNLCQKFPWGSMRLINKGRYIVWYVFRLCSLPGSLVYSPRGPNHIFYGRRGGVPGIFLGLKFWPKGFLGVCEIRGDFLGREKITLDLFGYCSFHHSNQQHKCNLLLVWDFFGYAKNVGIFLGR